MSRRRKIEISIGDKLVVHPRSVFESEVVRSGNGAMIRAFKRDIGKRVVVIVKDDEADEEVVRVSQHLNIGTTRENNQ